MYWKADDADADADDEERERKGKSCCYMYVYIPTDLSKKISFFSFCFFVSPRGDFLLHDSQDRARILVISWETETVFLSSCRM